MISAKLHLPALFVVFAVVLFGAATASAQTGPFSFFAVAPCRVVDTRNPVSTNGGPVLGIGTQRNFAIRNNCGVPAGAAAVSLNVTIAGATRASFLTIWPAGTTRPVVSTINSHRTILPWPMAPSSASVAGRRIFRFSTPTARFT